MERQVQYEALRAEIIAWQSNRTTVAMQIATAEATILGLVTSLAKNFLWTALTSTILVLLAASIIYTYYGAEKSSRIGAYIKVFLEDDRGDWESIRGEFPQGRFSNLNAMLANIYLALGVAALVVPLASANERGQPWYGWSMVGASGAMYVAALVLLYVASYGRRDGFEQHFVRIKAEIAAQDATP
ncbi:hypothetical protein [Pseudofrankia inefficax]|uniref:Transmembrane protein n=1 Tax=Pseudofrankia inefficax (strain DSM 45817 / CECT 9037 / DDB 130130 / EuI1c) TaxID=298654 RepID=E3IW87_PSEI1|nr:hypothetical protein [Pseudofrankia inefficax]ADP78929.1 hypothetical protein FraEuI1c_0851 [Pseudofrankia inefficax]